MQTHGTLSRRDFVEWSTSVAAAIALGTFLGCHLAADEGEPLAAGGAQMLILFGGGDGGGYNIVNGQIHPIPPLGPDLVEYLRTLGQLVRLGEVEVKPDVVAEARQAARSFVGHLSNFEKAGGVIVTDGRVADFAFADVDGGFICGNNGSQLRPFPPSPKLMVNSAAAVR